MISPPPHAKIYVATKCIDGRKGIDGLASVIWDIHKRDPMSGDLYLFLNRNRRTLIILMYDGQGYWHPRKRLSSGKFIYWPTSSQISPVEIAHVLWAIKQDDCSDKISYWKPIK